MSPRNHFVIAAYPSKGHAIPALNFARLLANAGFHLTFVSSLKSISAVELELQDATAEYLDRIHCVGLPIPHESYEKNDHEVSRDRLSSLGLPAEISLQMQEGFERLMDKLACASSTADQGASELGPPLAIISDSFCPWSQAVASKLGIPRYVLYTSSARYLAVQFYYPSMVAQGLLPLQRPDHDEDVWKDADALLAVPPLGTVSLRELPLSMKFPVSKLMHQFSHETAFLLHRAAGILLNSFYDLESSAIDALSEKSLNPNGVPIFPIGPVLPYPFFDPEQCETRSGSEKSRFIQWLDAQSASSVLYVSLGSIYAPSLAEIHEIAAGLEAAHVPFLWVLRASSSGSAPSASSSADMLPEGFQRRTQNQGLVAREWVPQPLILSHPATGGFLTHCGWNSTLESICAGVPMIAFPQFAEQEMNCRMIVDKWKVGLRLERGSDGSLRGGDLEKTAKYLLGGLEVAEGIRQRMKELRNAASRAIMQQDGSSTSNLRGFIRRYLEHSN